MENTHLEWLFRQLELLQLRYWIGKESESACVKINNSLFSEIIMHIYLYAYVS